MSRNASDVSKKRVAPEWKRGAHHLPDMLIVSAKGMAYGQHHLKRPRDAAPASLTIEILHPLPTKSQGCKRIFRVVESPMRECEGSQLPGGFDPLILGSFVQRVGDRVDSLQCLAHCHHCTDYASTQPCAPQSTTTFPGSNPPLAAVKSQNLPANTIPLCLSIALPVVPF